MSRSRERVTLEAGLKLDLNRLVRRGFIRRGACTRGEIKWTESFSGEQIATGIITADMAGEFGGWVRIDLGELKQTITLARQPRHFGGGQWYFVCPRTCRPASVLWRPLGAQSFACRQSWGRQVAYQSQFLDAIGRAHLGKDRINRRLCSIGPFDPDEWEFPPKPKWMRWTTYRCAEEKFDRYEAALDWGCLETVARILGPDWLEKAG
jgi:hypothetical protein